MKSVWNIINTETNRLPKENDVRNRPTCEEFNIHFTTCGSSLASQSDTPQGTTYISFPSVPTELTELRETNVEEVTAIIKQLHNKTSTDAYDINIRMIKETVDIIAPILTKFYNKCLNIGIFPDSLKIAKVHPIFKKGDATVTTNYRPISVLPILSKMLEKIILRRIEEYLEEWNYITDSQHGFRQNHSTTTALHAFVTEVHKAAEEKKHCIAYMCDLSKAFDNVSHNILRKKLTMYGFKGTAYLMLSNYLENRKQFVNFDDQNSSTLPNNLGVPQGSILAAILFVLYVNDLPNHLDCHTTLYADDTTLLFSEVDRSRMDEKIVQVLTTTEEWFTSNKLCLNKNKTQKISFTMDRWIPTTDPVKLLGIHLDSRLSYKTHVDHLCSRLSRATYALKRVSKVVGREAAVTAYFALHHSIVTYAIEIWGHTNHMQRVLLEQKRAVRSIEGLPSHAHCKPIFKRFQIMTAPAEYAYRVLIEMHHRRRNEIIHGNEVHEHNTRFGNQLRPPTIRLHSSEYLRRGVAIYNQCPENLKEANPTVFKRIVRNHLVKLSPYSKEEIQFTEIIL